MSNTVRISAVIPAYNREKTLHRSVESALGQSYPPEEIVVVDDGSTDATAGVAEAFGKQVRCIRQENRGPSESRNRGVREARAEWVAFLDSDDYWLEHHLERMAEAIDGTDGAAPLYFADMRRSPDEDGVLLWDACGFRVREPWELVEDASDWVMLSRQPMMLQSSVFLRRAFLDAGGLWNALWCRHDTHLYLKFCLGGAACAVAECGTEMTRDDDSGNRLTSAFGARQHSYWEETWRMYRDILTHTSLSPSHRRELRRRLASAHIRLAQWAKKEKRWGAALANMGHAVVTHPPRVLDGVGRTVKRLVRP